MPVPPPSQPQPELGPAMFQPEVPDPDQYRVQGFIDQYGTTAGTARTEAKPKSHVLGAIALVLVAAATVLAGVMLITIRDDLALALASYPETVDNYSMLVWLQSTLILDHAGALGAILGTAPLIAFVGGILGIIAAITNRGRKMALWAITIWLVTPFALWGYLALGARLGV